MLKCDDVDIYDSFKMLGIDGSEDPLLYSGEASPELN